MDNFNSQSVDLSSERDFKTIFEEINLGRISEEKGADIVFELLERNLLRNIDGNETPEQETKKWFVEICKLRPHFLALHFDSFDSFAAHFGNIIETNGFTEVIKLIVTDSISEARFKIQGRELFAQKVSRKISESQYLTQTKLLDESRKTELSIIENSLMKSLEESDFTELQAILKQGLEQERNDVSITSHNLDLAIAEADKLLGLFYPRSSCVG